MTKDETLGQRLKRARIQAGMSQLQLAEAAGRTKQAISKIENDWVGSPAVSTMSPVAAALGVTLEWLMSGKGTERPRDISPDAEDWADIRGVRQAAALGDGAVPDEYAETHKLKFRRDSLARKHLNPSKLAVIYGKGDSMAPTIEDGDAIMFDTNDKRPADGQVYVVNYDGDLFAKRLVQIGDTWCVSSDNTSIPKWRKPQPIDSVKGFEVLGKVVWVAGWMI